MINNVIKETNLDIMMPECMPDASNQMLTTSNMLSDGNAFYKIKLLDNELAKDDIFTIKTNMENLDNNKNKFIPSEGVAYLKGKYYYLYRGKLDDYSVLHQYKLKPGIYQTNDGEYVRIDPESEEEQKEYYYADKILNMDANELISAINNKTEVIRLTPDKAHSIIPDITTDDDILKRCIKAILKDKDIDIDSYKSRFINKNELFNLKQVLRGPKNITIMLFDRFINMANLKYTIIIEEAGDDCIGRPLSGPICVSTDDYVEWNKRKTLLS